MIKLTQVSQEDDMQFDNLHCTYISLSIYIYRRLHSFFFFYVFPSTDAYKNSLVTAPERTDENTHNPFPYNDYEYPPNAF